MNADATSRPGESRFLSNTGALVVQTVVMTLVTLVQVKLLASFLSRDDFGLFASLRGLSLLLAMLAANGLPAVLVRFLPVQEVYRRSRHAAMLGFGSMVASVVLLAALGLLANVGRGWILAFGTPEMFSAEVTFWFYAVTLGVTLKLVLYGALTGLRRLPAQVALEVTAQIFILGWIVWQRDQLTVALLFRIFGTIHIGTAVVGAPVFLALALRKPVTAVSPVSHDARSGIKMGQYLLWATALSTVALAFTDVDRYLLAHVLALETLALFHIAARVTRLANRMLSVPTIAFQPEVTRLDAEGRSVEHMSRIFIKFNSMIAIWLTLPIVLFSREIIVMVASTEYIEASPVLVLLAVSLPLTTVTAPITSVMKATDQVRGALTCDLVWMLLYVGLILLLGTSFGLIGVGVAQLSASFGQLVVALRLSRLPFGFGFVGGLYARLVIAGGISVIPIIVVLAVGPEASSNADLALRLTLFAAGSVAYRKLVQLFRVFTNDERDALLAMLRKHGAGVVGRILVAGS
ncbi:MAG: oligosaccharide flippase family protein [bacterium]|nr:oligosaccharide flippase family protein [bacterium]